jgi:2-amino-4-hydroxy-6-hydroxymethyldihydropteridine diphosphokinase
MVEVFVGLGSNVAPERHLSFAVASLTRHFGLLRCSRVYQSAPFGFSGADFLNMVAGFASVLPAQTVESLLSDVEQAGGRPPNSGRSGPRTLDLDLLLYGARVDPALRLPRVDVLQYPFVLAPLAELAPALRHPVTGISIDAAWQRVAATRPRMSCRGALDALT